MHYLVYIRYLWMRVATVIDSRANLVPMQALTSCGGKTLGTSLASQLSPSFAQGLITLFMSHCSFVL
jgi:hypothetical protein